MSYGYSSYHSPYYRYQQAYIRSGYNYESTLPAAPTNASPSPVDASQGSRDIGTSRLDVPSGGTMDLPRSVILQGSPRVVAPATGTQTSTDNSRTTGTQRTSGSQQKSGGKRGSGHGSTRGTTKTKTLSTTPNVKMPDASVSTTPVTQTPAAPPQNNGAAKTTTTSTPPPQQQNSTTNSSDRKTGSSRGGPP